MSWRVRYTPAARDDLKRLYAFLLDQDMGAAQRALAAIVKGEELLRWSPYSCRKVEPDNPLLRELLVSFGNAGYVLLYEIEDDATITILAVRHQREDDYH
ncbi:MAG TPA: type II toxin-antitoxin system RelE/ParE family toxin [Rhodanobacteraceae bacterium]|nr:type II toxin-antitoxin system RelE/ParE family toxin [Rhodanobacteraceae bacterium]